MTVFLAFLYYMGRISFVSMARQGTLSPEAAMWLPNLFFAIGGIFMAARLERPGDADLLGAVSARLTWLRYFLRQRRGLRARGLERLEPRIWLGRFSLLPRITDTYVITSFLFYFVMLLVSFVLMFHVFTFFELLSDIIKNHIPMDHVLTYHLFLTPRLIYEFTPVGVLAAVLVVFGVLAKNNEVTAFKACGISVYRLAAPVLIAGLVLSGSLFAFDHYWVPEADRRQDAFAPKSRAGPRKRFCSRTADGSTGLHDRVYYYKYFDQAAANHAGRQRVRDRPRCVSPEAPHLRGARALGAEPASLGVRERLEPRHEGRQRDALRRFLRRDAHFPGTGGAAGLFREGSKQSQQMNFQELEAYIAELKQSGFDTVALQVQLQKKFSVPLFALILAMVSIPFAFLAGNRGAMAGVGISLVIVMRTGASGKCSSKWAI